MDCLVGIFWFGFGVRHWALCCSRSCWTLGKDHGHCLRTGLVSNVLVLLARAELSNRSFLFGGNSVSAAQREICGRRVGHCHWCLQNSVSSSDCRHWACSWESAICLRCSGWLCLALWFEHCC